MIDVKNLNKDLQKFKGRKRLKEELLKYNNKLESNNKQAPLYDVNDRVGEEQEISSLLSKAITTENFDFSMLDISLTLKLGFSTTAQKNSGIFKNYLRKAIVENQETILKAIFGYLEEDIEKDKEKLAISIEEVKNTINSSIE